MRPKGIYKRGAGLLLNFHDVLPFIPPSEPKFDHLDGGWLFIVKNVFSIAMARFANVTILGNWMNNQSSIFVCFLNGCILSHPQNCLSVLGRVSVSLIILICPPVLKGLIKN